MEQVELAQVLVQSCSGSGVGEAGPDRNLCFAFALIFLRAVQYVPLTSRPVSYALDALKQVPIKLIEPDRLSTELGDALLVLAQLTSSSSSSPLRDMATEAPAVLSLLEWLVEQSHAGLPQLATLHGISTDTFAQLCDALARALPAARRAALEHVRMHLQTAPEEDAVLRGLETLPLPMADVRIALGELLLPQPTDDGAGCAWHTHRSGETARAPPDDAPTCARRARHGHCVAADGAAPQPGCDGPHQDVHGERFSGVEADAEREAEHEQVTEHACRCASSLIFLFFPCFTLMTDFLFFTQEFQSTMTSPVMVPIAMPVLPSNPYGMGLGPPFGS
jgi:hypothetical protein